MYKKIPKCHLNVTYPVCVLQNVFSFNYLLFFSLFRLENFSQISQK